MLVNEVKKLKKNLGFYFKNTKKNIIRTAEKEEGYRNNNFCRFCGKITESDKGRDNCHLTGKYKGTAINKCNINVTQKQSNFHTFYIS